MELSDVAAERAVLAGFCQFGINAYFEVGSIIDVNSFTFESNQSIYKCLNHLFKNREVSVIDIPSIWSAASDLGLNSVIERNDERDYLRGLFNFPITLVNVKKLAGKVKKLSVVRSMKRRLLDVVDEISSFTGDERIDKILSVPEKAVLQFSQGLEETEEAGLMGDGIEEYIKYLGENPRNNVGISTGMAHFNKYIGGGLLPGVNLLGARPKVGKTTFGDNVGMYITGQLGIPVLNIDTEMTKKNHWDRLLAFVSEVPVDEIRTGRFYSDNYLRRKVEEAGKKIKSYPYRYSCVRGMDMTSTISIMRRWIMKHVGFEESGIAKPCAIVYDYLKLASEDAISKNIQEYQALGFQINELHDFVSKYEIPCLALIQLNRDGITKEDASTISGSDRQVWACTSFCMFKKKSDAEMAEDPQGQKYNRKIKQLAARFAEEVDEGDYVNANMQGQFARITEGPSRNEASNIKQKGELIDDVNSIPESDRQF